jgi:hypothetical protein
MSLATLTVTAPTCPFFDGGEDYDVILDWKSTDAGVVAIGIASTFAAAQLVKSPSYPRPVKLRGVLNSIETSPGTLGAPATNPPTDLYDVTLVDNYGLDVADGNLANRGNTAAEVVVYASPIPINSELTLTIANAGNAKDGRMILHMGAVE